MLLHRDDEKLNEHRPRWEQTTIRYSRGHLQEFINRTRRMKSRSGVWTTEDTTVPRKQISLPVPSAKHSNFKMIIRYTAFTGPVTLNYIALGLDALEFQSFSSLNWNKYGKQLVKTEITECLAQHYIVIRAKVECKPSNGSEFPERLFTSIKTAFSLQGESQGGERRQLWDKLICLTSSEKYFF